MPKETVMTTNFADRIPQLLEETLIVFSSERDLMGNLLSIKSGSEEISHSTSWDICQCRDRLARLEALITAIRQVRAHGASNEDTFKQLSLMAGRMHARYGRNAANTDQHLDDQRSHDLNATHHLRRAVTP